MTITWNRVKIGGGGFLTGGSMSADGSLFLIKTDTYGAYKLNIATSTWDQLVRPSTMPLVATTEQGWGGNHTAVGYGCGEIRFAPSNLDRIWMHYQYRMFKSDDQGATFTESTAFGFYSLHPNAGIARLCTPRMDVDPINPDVVYVCTDYDGTKQTLNGGTSWADIGVPANNSEANPGIVCFDTSGGSTGGKTNIIYISVWDVGIYKSTNAGTSFSLMASTPTNVLRIKKAADGLIYIVSYQYESISPLSATCTITIASPAVITAAAGHGLYVGAPVKFSTTGALPTGLNTTSEFYVISAGFSSTTCQVSTTPGGSAVNTSGSQSGTHKIFLKAFNLYKLTGTTFTGHTAPGRDNINFCLDPNNAARIICCGDGTLLAESTDRGATWSAFIGSPHRIATDVPWLATCEENYMSTGEIFYDTQVANKLWLTEGIGVWHSTGGYANPGPQNWTSMTAGIEQMVAYYILCPNIANALPVLVSGDRNIFVPDTGDPTFQTYQNNQQWNPSVGLGEGPGADWASSDPTFIHCSVYDFSASSTNGGVTWTGITTQFPHPGSASDIHRSVACSTPLNWIVVAGSSCDPYYTLDGGVTWNIINPAGVPTTPSETGWNSQGVFNPRVSCCADRVTANTFYIHNYGPNTVGSPSGDAGIAGIYKSSDGGVSWSHVHTGFLVNHDNQVYNVRLRAVPGRAGHLFFTGGHVGSGGGTLPVSSCLFKRSTDGGVTWTTVSNVLEVTDFDWGPVAPGQTYPSMFIQGWVDQGSGYHCGMWRSDDECATWTFYGFHEPDWADQSSGVGADKNIFGRVYQGYFGSGWVFADSDPPPDPPDPPPPAITQRMGYVAFNM